MWRACGWQPPFLGCSARGSVRWRKKWNMWMCVCVCLCVRIFFFSSQCASTARFLLCQSVATTEHHGLAQPSISRLPWLSAYRHTRTNTHTWHDTHTRTQTTDILQFRQKSKDTRYVIKRLQLLCAWAQSTNNFSPKIQHAQSCRLVCHFLNFCACHTLLLSIWRTSILSAQDQGYKLGSHAYDT